MNTSDDNRQWLREAYDYARGERRALPSVEHVTAALDYAETCKAALVELRAELDIANANCAVLEDLLREFLHRDGPPALPALRPSMDVKRMD
jgi:uncharacterized protein YPO0396